jgi:hypothetical protein
MGGRLREKREEGSGKRKGYCGAEALISGG